MFEKLASWVDKVTAKPQAFTLALVIIAVWALSGPIFGFSDTWQLVINTGTTIVTFLMVFLLQNSQARQTAKHYLLTQKIELQEERQLRMEEQHGQLLQEAIAELLAIQDQLLLLDK